MRPPDQVIAWPVRVCVQPLIALASSISKSAGEPIVTRTPPAGSVSFGTLKTRSTSAPATTAVGVSDMCAAAGPAAASAASAAPALEAQVARDDHPLHLIRPFADLEDLLVAVEPRDRVLVHEAVAPVDLERPACGAVRQLARVELRHRRRLPEVASRILLPGGAVDESPRGLDLGRHVDQLL